ncbi:MAG: prolyl oligopeptidase family serine peptidase [Bacteroidia bacterium]
MKKLITSFSFIFIIVSSLTAQKTMTPEMLMELAKVSGLGITKDNKSVIFQVRNYTISTDKNTDKFYTIPLAGGDANMIDNANSLLPNNRKSIDGKYSIISNEIKIKKTYGTDYYPDLKNSNVMIYDNLNYRHWDTWEDGAFGHVFLNTLKDNKVVDSIDLMPNEPFDCPQKPFGGNEDFIWSNDGKQILYVCKKKYGAAYAISTNTDIYAYDISTKKTTNLTEGMMGYDIKPTFSSTGTLAFLSMKTDGYESDKNDLVISNSNGKINLTKDWDGTVSDYLWSTDGKEIYFVAPIDGTVQLFSVNNPELTKKQPVIKQITKGDFDVKKIVAQVNNTMVVERTDMNHATELYTVDITKGTLKQLTHINDATYNTLTLSKVEKRYVTTADGQKMQVWVIYPPNFDPAKKYATLLYCQGGPQAEISQFYSTRWNFQLMAANDYIIVAPNRRGLPGFGVKWNEEISKDYGGKNMLDYLTAIDEISKEPFVDKARLGCIGASYGGYSVYYLAGHHNKRFKTFIAHDGIFDWTSMYGTTEELFFVNYDLGGPYWDKKNTVAQKAYNEFNPVNFVNKWDTPILIIQGGQDFRVPIGQGLAAFQAAQLQGIKSKLLYFPTENHWVLQNQNAIVWHHEFYKWLKETL